MFTKYFDDPSAPINIATVDIYNWLALAQHYNEEQRYPTRLVAITTDPLVGLYFAVASRSDDPGFVFCFNYNFNDLETAGEVSKLGGTFLDVLKIQGRDGLDYHPQKSTLSLLKPPFPNARLQKQSGSFIWTRSIGENYNDTGGFPFEVHPEKKPAIIVDLDKRGYNANALFPDHGS